MIVGAWNRAGFLQGALDFAAWMVIKAEDTAVKSWDTHIAGVPVRAFRPAKSANKERLPTVLFYHGGGWIFGSVGKSHIQCTQLWNSEPRPALFVTMNPTQQLLVHIHQA